ncbi:MAG: NAD(P)/FAD-dependent oxidoreductase [Hyphomicrobiales bacterium]
MTQHFDIAIVGASFAGLVCARTAALRGLSVAVIDAKAEPGARVHTTGILVKEAANELDVPHRLTRHVHGVRLYAPNLSSVDLFAPGYYFLTTQTADLLRWLADEAERAGARLFCGTRLEGAGRQDGVIKLRQPDISAQIIVGADGARSTVAKTFDLDRNKKFLTGLEIEYENLGQVDGNLLHCFVNSDIAPGYLAWAAAGPDVTQIGLATGHGRKPDLNKFLKRTDHLFGYGSARIVGRRSGLIPCGGALKNFAAPGVLLIGDAAGLVSPMTGGGIFLAFRSGRRAAQAICDYLQDLGPAPETILRKEVPRFAVKKLMRAGLDLAPPNWLLNMLLATPPMHALARQVYFHKRGGAGMGFAEYMALRAQREKANAAVSHARQERMP